MLSVSSPPSGAPASPRSRNDFAALRQRLSRLPREARDTLFLLLVIAWIIAPHLGHLPTWCGALALATLLGRGALALAGRPLPGAVWRVGLLLLAVGATLATHRTLFGRDAGVTLIVVLLALKTLELRARRDAFVVFFLGFFTMLTNFFFSQSLTTAAAMLVALLGLLTALVNAHRPVGRPSLGASAGVALRLALWGTPVMVALFLLFPRVAPLWSLPTDARSAKSGLSATMEVGAITQLALDDSIAMRVKFDGAVPPQPELYFRGPVLSEFDGRIWRPRVLRRSADPAPDLQALGAPVRYQVTLEPTQQPWLFALDAVRERPRINGLPTRLTPDLQWVAERPVTELLRYTAQSHPQYRLGPQQADGATRIALQDDVDLPPGFNPRTLQLAADLQRDPRLAGRGAQALVDAVLERLRTGGYRYTLEPAPAGVNTADAFWFDTKEGFCEHIASAFVVLMRALDVPARVVTGYQGGELNRLDGFLEVRQSDAHAWAEVWIAGQGWVRVDPTAAVAPGRTGTTQRLAPPQGAITQAIGTLSPDLLARLRQGWSAINNSWNQWVLNYTQNRQLEFLRNLGFEEPDWRDLARVLAALLGLAAAVSAIWALWQRTQHDPWLRLLGRARARLRRAGLPVPDGATPRAMVQLLQSSQPPATQAKGADSGPLVDWLLALERWRYARPSDDGSGGPAHRTAAARRAQLAALRRRFTHLPWPPRR
ncbi:MAG: protein-glutamine gamma-glutamyltransferase TgpA [Tibeticola sp.]